MGSYFSTKSELLVLEAVMGKQDELSMVSPSRADELKPRYEHYQKSFLQLDPSTKSWVMQEAALRYAELEKSWLKRSQDAVNFLASIPIFEMVWAIFSVIIPIGLLLYKPWALKGVWLMPLVALLYAWQITSFGVNAEAQLYPQEDALVENSQEGTLDEQRVKLTRGWENYLITHYAKETPSLDTYNEQLARGEFLFNLERIKYFPKKLHDSFWQQKPYLILWIYVLWNLAFASLTLWQQKVNSNTRKITQSCR